MTLIHPFIIYGRCCGVQLRRASAESIAELVAATGVDKNHFFLDIPLPSPIKPLRPSIALRLRHGSIGLDLIGRKIITNPNKFIKFIILKYP